MGEKHAPPKIQDGGWLPSWIPMSGIYRLQNKSHIYRQWRLFFIPTCRETTHLIFQLTFIYESDLFILWEEYVCGKYICFPLANKCNNIASDPMPTHTGSRAVVAVLTVCASENVMWLVVHEWHSWTTSHMTFSIKKIHCTSCQWSPPRNLILT